MDAIRDFRIAIKGPLTTPVGGGIRSLNVTLRQVLDLYACVRPVRYFEGVPSPVRNPERMNIVIFRENTEDVYAGIEWRSGTPEVKKLIDFLNNDMLKGGSKRVREDSGVGIKPISPFGTKRLVRRAIQDRLTGQRPSMDVIAEALHMSPRTLQRRLQESGSSFQRVLDEARHQMARYYLSNSALESNEAAYLLGFEDTWAFLVTDSLASYIHAHFS